MRGCFRHSRAFTTADTEIAPLVQPSRRPVRKDQFVTNIALHSELIYIAVTIWIMGTVAILA
jgi:hypothetical protein